MFWGLKDKTNHSSFVWETCTLASNTNLLPCVLSRLSPEERAHVEAQLEELKATYNQLCDSSTQQLQQLEQQLAKEEERKVAWLEEFAELQRENCRFMTKKNVFSAFSSLTKCNREGAFIKCCFESEYACELSVSSCVGQRECVRCTACCVFTECAFLTNITTIDELIDLVWFNKHHRAFSDVCSDDFLFLALFLSSFFVFPGDVTNTRTS